MLLVSHEPYPTTTHPEVLVTVLDFLLDCGCQVVVAAATPNMVLDLAKGRAYGTPISNQKPHYLVSW